jgi:hypothetical protein
MLPPHIAAIIDAKARQATKTFTENSALAGAKDGKSVQQQVQEQLGVMEPWNQFEQAADPVQDIAKRNATGNPLPDQAGQVAPTAEEILLQSPQEWQALFGSQVPDTSGALAAYQQASAHRPEIPDFGRPRVDQTQQFIASLGALFDPKNAGQIMGLPTQNAQTDYEYKVKDAMRRYQMNNQDYEAKVELAKAILQNAEKEAAQAIASNQTGYKEYAQNVRNTNDNNARDRQVAAAIAGRADVAKTNRDARMEIINAQLIGRSKQQLMGIALQAADPLEREAAAIKLYELDGTVVTSPKTTGAQKKIAQGDERLKQGAQRITDARAKNAPAIEYAKLRNEWYPAKVQSEINARDAQAARSRELTARGGNTPSGVTGRIDNQTKTALKYQIGTWEMEMAAAKKVLEDIKSGKVNPLTDGNGLAVASAALKRIDKLEQNLMIARQKLQGKRPLAGDGREVLPDPAAPPVNPPPAPGGGGKGGGVPGVVRRNVRSSK